MTPEQRAAIRKALLDAGMVRANMTQDEGDGRYGETFRHPTNSDLVIIAWGPRT